MSKKKNIDDLFKEQFKNFEATPSPDVWNNIEAKLKEDDDRKVIPLWIKLAGIAALLALLFTVGNSIFNSPINNSTSPIVTEDASEIEKNKIEKNSLIEKEPDLTTTNKEENKMNSEVVENTSEEKTNHKSSIQKKSQVSETSVAYENEVQKTSDKNDTNNLIKEPTKSSTSEETVIATKNVSKDVSESEKSSLINKETEINPIVIGIEKEAIATENTSENENTETAIKEENKKSIFDEINKASEEEVAVVTLDNKPDYRWEIAPNIGPVFYNSLSEGSSIDPSFSDNPQSSDVNIAYGVQIAYNLNNRFSIRSGISNVNLGYSTSGLDLGTGPVAASTSYIDYNKRGDVTIPVDKGTLVNQNSDGGFGEITPKSTSGEVVLNQKISYYEVPLELKYALLNKKFGINIIGGFSTLLLGDNEITVDAGDFNEVLGEASNLSSLSFTTNLGLGLNYSFSKKLMFNIEPIFKYQLNPYTDSSVEFKPYYIGIYSGLSFKF
ncbi:MAG: outer membrane beta-barrel protein [Flavobacteriaceae bacterium]